MNETLRLTQLSAELLRLTGQPGPGYPVLYRAVISGKIPAHFEGRCWLVNRGDIPAIIAAVG